MWELLFDMIPVMDEDGKDMKKKAIGGVEVRGAFREL